jgi:hypothetical protein
MPGDAVKAERILRSVASDEEETGIEEEFVFEWERHAALLRALDWPEVQYQQGFDYLVKDAPQSGWRLVG